MRVNYIQTGWIMTVKELVRRRIVVVLFFLIPSLFYIITNLTTPQHPIVFKLASLSEEIVIRVSQLEEALVFMGLAATGLLGSFLALSLIQKNTRVNRRLVICGFQSSEIAVAKLAVLLGVIVIVGSYVAVLLLVFFQPRHLINLVLGFWLVGYVYGCYGLLIGSIFKRELEGILLIVLLTNIDVGWLQNPLFYAEAQNKIIIRYLPAFFPSQVSMVSAFSDYSILKPVLGSLVYGSIFVLVALIIFGLKMRISRV